MVLRVLRSTMLVFALLGAASSQAALPSPNQDSLFSAHCPLELAFTADFSAISAAKRSDAAEEEFPIKIRDLANPRHVIIGAVSERGFSSKWPGEGDFPKLKLDLDRASTKGTIFEDSRKLRVNTHVSTHPTRLRTPLGRLNDERSPYREALVFELGRALGFPMHFTRRAQITYRDLGTDDRFRRMALFIEDDKALTARFNAREIKPPELAMNQDTGISFEQSARVHLFQGLIGNNDYVFRTRREPPRLDDPGLDLGNIFLMEHADGSRTLVPYDFDLSTLVAGEGRLKDFWKRYPEFDCRTDVQSYQCWNITQIRARHPRADVLAAVEFFRLRRGVIEAVIRESVVDDIGRRVAERHVVRFYKYLDHALNMPVVARPGIAFLDSSNVKSKLKPAEGGGQRFLRPGTPIRLLGVEGKFTRAAILDFKWDLLDGANGTGYILTAELEEPDSIADWVPE